SEPPLDGSTPTLELPGGAAHECFQVPVGDGSGWLYRWSWVVDQRNGTLAEATIVQATLAAGFPHFRVVPRHGHTAPSSGWDESELELESVEFCRQFRLLAGRDGDREALLQLFDPEMIVWFLGQGATMAVVEYRMGTLALVSRFVCTDDLEFDA